MTTTPLTAIRQDGTMYLQEENPYPEWHDLEEPNVLFADFEIDHPPVIALFECEEGQQFFEGMDVVKVNQVREWFISLKSFGQWICVTDAGLRFYQSSLFKGTYETRPAFQLIEKQQNDTDVALIEKAGGKGDILKDFNYVTLANGLTYSISTHYEKIHLRKVIDILKSVASNDDGTTRNDIIAKICKLELQLDEIINPQKL